MNIAQIENNLQLLVNTFNKESFIYDLLLAYGQPKATIKRIKDGGLNLSKVDDEIAWKKKLFFKSINGVDLHVLIADLKESGQPLLQKHQLVQQEILQVPVYVGFSRSVRGAMLKKRWDKGMAALQHSGALQQLYQRYPGMRLPTLSAAL